MITSLRLRREFLALQNKKPVKQLGDGQLPASNLASYKCQYFICNARLRLSGEYHNQVNRLGLVASKKIGGAVIRNRAKRRLRALWLDANMVQGNNNLDFVFIASAKIINDEFPMIKIQFQRAIQQILGKFCLIQGTNNG